VVKPKAIVFDIGSTLWSSPPEDAGALHFCYSRGREYLMASIPDTPSIEALIDAVEGYFAEWEEIWRLDNTRVTQEPTTKFVAEALAKLGVSPPADTLAAFTAALLETSIYTAKAEVPEPGMPEALAALKALGLRLGCVSNAFMTAAGLHEIMLVKGLGQYLDLTVSSCEFGYRKPHPSIYLAAGQGLGVSPEETIFVGDRLDADIEGPAALGMRTVLTHQYRVEDPANAKVQPATVIKHLSEMVPYVESLLKAES
jgi:HAD superfamily hydrolase (TIGR01509 family)